MKTNCTFLVLLFVVCNSYSQKVKLPSFGNIDQSDVEMTSCEIDPNAEAYKLLDLGEVTYSRGRNLFQMNFKRRIRIKILKEKGIGLANVKIPFRSYSNYERINDLSAVTYNIGPDGKVVTTKLSKDAIFTQKVDKRYSTITFTMPEVKVGSVIEYRFTDIKENPVGLDDWLFQDDIPTRYSSYTAVIPEFFKYVSQVMVNQHVDKKQDEVFENINTENGPLRFKSVEAVYTMQKIPALKEEPFMSSYKDYQQRIQFQLSQIDFGNGNITDFRTSWGKLTNELLEDEDFGLQLRKNIPRTKDLDEQLKGVTEPFSKMLIIHNYVRTNMSWNGHESIYTSAGVKDAWDKKTGNNGEINLILINLLRDADVPVAPLLVSSRDHGSTNALYPFLGQFNNVVAYVSLNNKNYVLNAADKYNPATLIPYDIVNTEAFLLGKEVSTWITLYNNKQKWKNVVSILADVDATGNFNGEAVVYSYDYSRNPRTKKYREHKSSFMDYFTGDKSSMSISDLAVVNLETDTLPLEQKLKFTTKLNSAGEYRYFNLNLFTGLEKNPFIADTRNTDVNFGFNQSYGIYGSVNLPEDYKVEELPPNISMIMPDTSVVLKRFLQLEGNILSFRITVDFSKPHYTVAEYPDFKEFNKKLYARLSEQIVIKKKNTAP